MTAHATTLRCRPGRFDDLVQALHDRILVLARSEIGYRGLYLFAERGSDNVVALSLWDTIDDAHAHQESSDYQAHLAAMDEWLAAPDSTAFYDVVTQA